MSKSKPLNVLELVPDKVPKKAGTSITSPIVSFARKLASHPDAKQGSELVAGQAGLLFDQSDGAELEKSKQAQTEQNARWQSSCERMSELEKKKSNTKQWIKTGLLNSGKENGDVSWKDWRPKDKVLLIFTLSCLVLTAGLGMSNVYANLMASGEPVFLDQPFLAVALASLLPISSAAIKFVTNFMSYSSTRRRYALAIYALTLIAVLLWSILFALNFTGVTAGIDWGDLDGGNGKGSALVWAQLIVEMLAASALFLAAEDIYLRYAPDWWTENPEFIENERAIASHKPEHEKLREARATTHGRIVELSAARQAAINEAVAEYLAMRSRYAAAND